jgi:transcriptional regulator with XRE-family HTH domain
MSRANHYSMSLKLPNYVRTYRKRAGLSQDELAFLLGCEGGTKVSRYERFARHPSLETVLACEAIFGVQVRDLFAGVFEKVEEQIKRRARILLKRLEKAQPGQATTHKLQSVRRMFEPGSKMKHDNLCRHKA